MVPAYTTIPGSDAITTGVDTTKPGFRLFTWLSPGQPNRVYWSNEQLLGLHGTNQADLTGFTNSGYMYWTNNYLNFFTGIGGNAGNFTAPNGYTDVQFPGLGGTTDVPYVNNPSASMEVLCFLRFQNPGLYQMGVNSDDGFAVTEGPSPQDRFATVLGQFDGGRGPSDTTFSFIIPKAGFYPFRLLYENGNGGTGALEWFMVTNGVRTLINDPDPTNTTGVTAFFVGPALPAYVSQIKPYPDQNGVRPDQVLVQLTDGSTSVTQNSIKLTVSGSGVTSPAPTISKVGSVTTAALNFSPLLLSGSNYTATLVWSDNATPTATHSNTWAFTVLSSVTLDSSLAVPLSGITANPPGFILQVAQMDNTFTGAGNGVPNQIDAFDALNTGLYFPWFGSSVVDTTGSVVASNNIAIWTWTNQVDFNIIGYATGGDYANPYQMPGTLGLTSSGQDVVAWLDSYVVFPTAGFYEMGVNSDDGFRLSEGYGLKRQVLHVTGTGINTDVAAVVSTTNYLNYGNGGFGGTLPQTPISGQILFVNSNNFAPGGSINLTGKIALVDTGLYGQTDAALCYIAQTNGAIGFIEIHPTNGGTPVHMGGTGPGPINIPALNVNGANGQRDFWLTNGTLTASIGSAVGIVIAEADYGRGDSHTDGGFVVPVAGAYPLHLSYFGGNSGGNNVEWTVLAGGIAADGIRTLMNDTTNKLSLLAYQTAAGNPNLPKVSISNQGTTVTITYTGTLQSSPTANGPYSDVSGATCPYTFSPVGASAKFYRTRM